MIQNNWNTKLSVSIVWLAVRLGPRPGSLTTLLRPACVEREWPRWSRDRRKPRTLHSPPASDMAVTWRPRGGRSPLSTPRQLSPPSSDKSHCWREVHHVLTLVRGRHLRQSSVSCGESRLQSWEGGWAGHSHLPPVNISCASLCVTVQWCKYFWSLWNIFTIPWYW